MADATFGDDRCRYTFVDGEPYIHVLDAAAVLKNAARVVELTAVVTGTVGDYSDGVTYGLSTAGASLRKYHIHRLTVETSKMLEGD